jgi:cytochrome c1
VRPARAPLERSDADTRLPAYFPGTKIAMARVLYDGLVEYEDGTPATTTQSA